MNNPKIYLAGPIAGLLFEDCIRWRNKVKKDLKKHGITGISPLDPESVRLKKETRPMNALGYPKDPLSCAKGITAKDRWYCTQADMLLVNFLGAKQVSLGTVIEIGWADAHRIPIIMVMEPTGNPHDHAMINECAGFRVNSLEEALTLIKSMMVH